MKKHIILYFIISIFFFTIGAFFGKYKVTQVKKGLFNLYEKFILQSRELPNDYIKTISLKIKPNDFNVLKKKRNNALLKRNLTRTKNDFVPVSLIYNNEKFHGKIRLKGKDLDHFNDDKKWSFRIKLKGGKLLNEMKTFALQHPKTRSFLVGLVC